MVQCVQLVPVGVKVTGLGFVGGAAHGGVQIPLWGPAGGWSAACRPAPPVHRRRSAGTADQRVELLLQFHGAVVHAQHSNTIIAEARWLAGEGVKELIVVAQDPTAYGEDWGKPGSICELLDKLNKVPGLEWIRIMYAYPERITDEFIAAMKRNEKVVPYLDLPIQHCNDTILKNMNRRSTRAELLEVIGKLRREIPGITLRTTLIAGFPGETEEQFEDLCNFVKEVQFDRLGCFAYSAEENTVAAKMDGQIEQEVKDKRAELVMQIQTGIMAQKQAEKVGQTVHVLCDGIDEENGLYLCRTTGDAPEVDGCVCVSSEEPLYPGQFYDVLVEDSDLYDLYGTVVK